MKSKYRDRDMARPNYTVRMSIEAGLADRLATTWGQVAGDYGGETSAGHPITRLQTPEELVERACKTAELLVAAWEAHGWIEVDPRTDEEVAEHEGRITGIISKQRWGLDVADALK